MLLIPARADHQISDVLVSTPRQPTPRRDRFSTCGDIRTPEPRPPDRPVRTPGRVKIVATTGGNEHEPVPTLGAGDRGRLPARRGRLIAGVGPAWKGERPEAFPAMIKTRMLGGELPEPVAARLTGTFRDLGRGIRRWTMDRRRTRGPTTAGRCVGWDETRHSDRVPAGSRPTRRTVRSGSRIGGRMNYEVRLVKVRWVTPVGEETDSMSYVSSMPSSPSQSRTPRPSRIGTTTTFM